jgi:2-polyprenyl-3-methyl-5-hydroxy-6-metoxy-1,4-benzoquinol methylase
LAPEILDTLATGSPEEIHARRDLRIFNRVMGNHDWFVEVLRLGKARGLKILEVGAGDGELAQRLNEEGFVVDALDRCPPPRNWPEDRKWLQTDIMEFRDWKEYPVIIANLFLHHLAPDELCRLGEQVTPHARLFVASEPARRRRFQYLFALTCLVCGANAVSRHDGQVSIAAGFSGDELAREMKLDPARWHIEARVRGRGAYRFSAQKKL